MPSSRSARISRRATALLGGLTPAEFMRGHWQKKPLLIRGALPRFEPLLSRERLFTLAAHADVEARLVARRGKAWTVLHGPFAASAFPARREPNWTLLVQGVDLHDDAAHRLLRSFRFVPDARLDDLMISWASDGGGVGPHVDSYDVFLLQVQGRRRWRIGRLKQPRYAAKLPLRILTNFVAEQDFVLEPGDMLYLPPNWAHDGTAVDGECMTYSIGYRAAHRGELAAAIAQRLADDHTDDRLYADRQLEATDEPGRVPKDLVTFAADAVRRLLDRPDAIARAAGEVLTEPKQGVWFERRTGGRPRGDLVLDRRTRLLYDDRHVFINGESTRVSGKDATLLRRLADERALDTRDLRGASAVVKALLTEWFGAGWLHARDPDRGPTRAPRRSESR